MAQNHTPVEHHASKPGIKSFIVMAAVILGIMLIANADAVKKFFGME